MPKPSLREGCSSTSAKATTCVERRRREHIHETRGLSHGPVDGVAVASRRRHLPKVEVQKTSETDTESLTSSDSA